MSILRTMREWDTLLLDGVSLPDEAAARMVKTLRELGILQITELARGLEIKSNSYVGRLTVGDFELRIQPKLDGLPLMRLFCYAYGLENILAFGEAHYETSRFSFFDLLIEMLRRYVDKLIRRGISKGYVQREAGLSNVRGRVDMGRLAAIGGVITETLPCRFFQREEDTLLNRVVLSGLRLARSFTADPVLKQSLQRCIHLLSESVGDVRLDQTRLLAARRTMTRMTENYGSILDLIEVLLESQSSHLDAEGAAVLLPGCFFDMNRFFERLVLKLLRELSDEYLIIDQLGLRRMYAYNPQWNPNQKAAPTPRPDFALSKRGTILRLLDAKYRDLWDRSLPRDMLYQLSVYALSGVGDGTATILYPALSDTPTLQKIDVRHPLEGRVIAHVELRPINLAKISDLLVEPSGEGIRRYMRTIVL